MNELIQNVRVEEKQLRTNREICFRNILKDCFERYERVCFFG